MDGNTVAATAVIDRRLHELELAIYGREKSDIDGLLQRVAKQEKAIEAFKVALRAEQEQREAYENKLKGMQWLLTALGSGGAITILINVLRGLGIL